MGSCFAEHMGRKLEERRFQPVTNPFGILYNPVSLARGLDRLREGRPYEARALFRHGELWHSWDHHGRFSHPRRENALQGINRALQAGHHLLQQAPWLLLTLGTAWVYRLKDSGRIVANNHKLPASAFEKGLLPLQEVTAALDNALSLLPDTRVILTVSPVRHLRDGLVDNQRSKATLLLAAHELCRRFERVHYFPAYELILDELRDYRYYEADMIHPNAQAVDYVWEVFLDTYLADEARSAMQAVERVLQAIRHRPLHPDTEAHRQFCRAQLDHLQKLKNRYPGLDLTEFEAAFQQRLSAE